MFGNRRADDSGRARDHRAIGSIGKTRTRAAGALERGSPSHSRRDHRRSPEDSQRTGSPGIGTARNIAWPFVAIRIERVESVIGKITRVGLEILDFGFWIPARSASKGSNPSLALRAGIQNPKSKIQNRVK